MTSFYPEGSIVFYSQGLTLPSNRKSHNNSYVRCPALLLGVSLTEKVNCPAEGGPAGLAELGPWPGAFPPLMAAVDVEPRGQGEFKKEIEIPSFAVLRST